MSADLLDLYTRAADWTAEKVAGVTDLSASTPCDDWTVRDLLNHMLDTQRYFAGAARGEDVSPPGPQPPDLLTGDPDEALAAARASVLEAFGQDGVVEKTGPALGIAFSDLLLHGWDVARATGQDSSMPDGLAAAAFEQIHGKFTDEQRKGLFKAKVPVGADATAQQRLLGYTGRDPS